jgi:hypothetical protein
MSAEAYPLHHRSEVDDAANQKRLFAQLDDQRRLASHTEKPSLMTAGASMHCETDAQQGRAVVSVIRMSGRMLALLSKTVVAPSTVDSGPGLRPSRWYG